MAIPPIISNSPIFKLLRTQGNDVPAPKQGANTAQTAEDVVSISETAQQRLNAIRDLKSEGEEAVRQTSQKTASLLSENQNVSLGADPAFDQD